MLQEREFSSVIPLFAIIDRVEAEAAPDGQRIAPLNGNGQALAQEISLTQSLVYLICVAFFILIRYAI